MKIWSFSQDGKLRLGVQRDDHVVDLTTLDSRLPADAIGLLTSGSDSLRDLRSRIASAPASACRPVDSLQVEMPVPRPGKIVCLGVNYLEHLKESQLRDTRPTQPTVFMRIPSSFVPHGGGLVKPDCSEQFDYEGELVAVIGRQARNVTEARALDYVVGYTCANEGTVRDYQRHTSQWGMGKNFDRSGSIGPCLVTADELPPGGAGLHLETRVNGTVRQSDNTSSMTFPLAKVIEYLTRGITLEPGDIILTGTPAGVGAAQKPVPLWLRQGDILEVEIEGIGILRNKVVNQTYS